MSKEKKIFSPKIYNAGGLLEKRWYVYYNEFSRNGIKTKRVAIYGKINNYTTFADRTNEANSIVKRLIEGNYFKSDRTDINQIIDRLPIREKSKKAYIGKANALSKFCKKNLHEVNVQDAKLFVNSLYKLHQTTKNNYILTLKLIFTHLISEGIIKVNPFNDIKTSKTVKTSKQYFNKNQIEYLKLKISSVNPQLWLFVQFMFYTLARPNEIRNLLISDIDFCDYKICFRGSISKNKKTQFVNVPNVFRSELDKLKNYPVDMFVFGKFNVPGYLIQYEDYFYKLHKKYLKSSVFGGNYSLYSWKHTGAVMAVKNGINLKELQIQLRHHSLDMVNEYLKNIGVNECEGIVNNYPIL